MGGIYLADFRRMRSRSLFYRFPIMNCARIYTPNAHMDITLSKRYFYAAPRTDTSVNSQVVYKDDGKCCSLTHIPFRKPPEIYQKV